MKKQVLFVFMLFLAFSLPAMAQNKDPKMEARIQLARDKYAEGKDLVAQNEDKETPFNYATVVRKQNWPATGQRTEETKFYYNEIGNEEEPDLKGYALRMVCNTYNVAARNYYEEYLYDNNGRPLFYYAQYDEINQNYSGKTELRQYYDEAGEVIHTIYKTSDKDGKMQKISANSNSEVVESGKFMLRFVSDNFAHLKAVFDAIYNTNTNE